jgi:tellurite resistance protein TerC
MEWLIFSGFLVVVLAILFIDLGIFDKHSHKTSLRESLIWISVWVGLALVFYFFLRFYGHLLHGIDSFEKLSAIIKENGHPISVANFSFEEALKIYNRNLSLEYITGYVIEYTLSLDNVFVIFMLFVSFNVKEIHYKRVLFWGILGAIIFRFLFIFLLSALIHKFEWMFYVFGAILFYSGIKMFVNRNKEEKVDPQHHPLVKFASKYFHVFPRFVGENFFVKKSKRLYVTPLFVVLLLVEFSDIIFAFDSIPAIFSVTKDPYIVFFSNIFAILGLRTLFFLVVHLNNLFKYLKVGISFLLIFIGFKLMFHSWLVQIGFTTQHSLMVVLFTLILSIAASLIVGFKEVK